LQSHFDAFDALGQEHKQSHTDIRELWKYTTELHSTLRSIVQLPAQYTDLMNETERVQIHTEHQALMRSLHKMRSDIDTFGGARATSTKNVTQRKAKLANLSKPGETSKPHAHPNNTDFARLTNMTTADTISRTFQTTTTKPTTNPTITNLPSSTYSNNVNSTTPRVDDTLDVSSVDYTNDMLLSNDSSTDSLSNTNTLSATSSDSSSPLPAFTNLPSSSSHSAVDTHPERLSRVQKQRVPTHTSYISNSGKQKNGQYTLLSLPTHSTSASDRQRKQKMNVNFVRPTENGRVVPVSLQRHLFINSTHNNQHRHERLSKIRQTASHQI
jgi:hypothetical protein